MTDVSTEKTDDASGVDVRRLVRKRLEKRRSLQGGVAAYVVVNGALVAIWAFTGGGYFWPGWVLALWGAGMLLGLWDYFRGPVTDAEVDEELRRMAHRRTTKADEGGGTSS